MPTSERSGESGGRRARRVRKRRHQSSAPSYPAPGGPARWLVPVVGGFAVLGLVLFLLFGDALNRPGSSPAAGTAPNGGAEVKAERVVPASVFDKDRAFSDLRRQVQFGPRVPSTAGHVKCRDWLLKTLQPLAGSVERQDLTRVIRGSTLRMTNVIARWKGTGASTNGVLLCGHWDTRPTADREVTPARRRLPIAGANDGASEVAVLMEIARALKRTPPPVPVMLVFFDGEDYGPGISDMFLGSEYFADHLPADVPRRGVLIDMIGDRDLRIPIEAHSNRNARDVVEEVYGTAARLGYGQQFPPHVAGPIEDDHVALQRKGLKVIDLIDFNYGPGHSWWHTLADTPDKCSPDSLKAVGDVVLEWTYTRR